MFEALSAKTAHFAHALSGVIVRVGIDQAVAQAYEQPAGSQARIAATESLLASCDEHRSAFPARAIRGASFAVFYAVGNDHLQTSAVNCVLACADAAYAVDPDATLEALDASQNAVPPGSDFAKSLSAKRNLLQRHQPQ